MGHTPNLLKEILNYEAFYNAVWETMKNGK